MAWATFLSLIIMFYFTKNHQRCSTCPTQEVGVDGGCLIRTTCINEDRWMSLNVIYVLGIKIMSCCFQKLQGKNKKKAVKQNVNFHIKFNLLSLLFRRVQKFCIHFKPDYINSCNPCFSFFEVKHSYAAFRFFLLLF